MFTRNAKVFYTQQADSPRTKYAHARSKSS